MDLIDTLPPPVRLLFVLAYVAWHRGPDIPLTRDLLIIAGIEYPTQEKTYRWALSQLQKRRLIRVSSGVGRFPNVHLNLDDKRRVILWPEEGGDPRAVRPQQQEPEC